MGFARIRLVASAAGAAALFLSMNLTIAQSQEPKAGSQRPPATEGEAPKKVDEFAEAAKALIGAAGHPECVWLGRRAIRLLFRDDLDTAFRHMELYDRFGCPPNHIQAAFRCLVRQGELDSKAAETLSARVHACWINPTPEIANAPAAAAVPAPTANR
jgi:hypothetical protein